MSERSLRRFERDALGAPVIPPPAIARWATALRRRLLGVHRRLAPPPVQVLEALFSSFDAHVLRALVELGIPDELQKPSTISELAERVGADPTRLERLLRYAAARGLVGLDRRGRVRSSPVTDSLRGDAAAPWRGWVRFATSDWFDASWRNLSAAVKPEVPTAFELAHGTDFFGYTTEIDPEAGVVFDQAMAAGATLQGIVLSRALDWDGVETVLDVGGGYGATLGVLQRYHPHLSATLFDLPEVVERARFDGDGRSIVGGSFFDGLPAGHDRYLLLAIVHDWDDNRAIAILTNVAAAMGPEGEAIVVENVASERPRDDFAAASDLLMFVLATGRERTVDQYRRLFGDAGLRITRQRLLATGATAFTLRAIGR